MPSLTWRERAKVLFLALFAMLVVFGPTVLVMMADPR